MLNPENFGVDQLLRSEIEGGTTIEESAQLFMNIISGQGTTAQNNVVCANAGMAIVTVNGCSPMEGFEPAKEIYLLEKDSKHTVWAHENAQTLSSINFQHEHITG
jgi:anthranilate phosphoribosyltransferase